MLFIPAIDVMSGKVVRLTQGDYAQRTVYHEDPSEVAEQFEAQGATHLHVVDLDGAKSGKAENLDVIKKILKSCSLKVQVGGGIRNEESASRWIDAGVDKVVVGTAAVKNPEFVAALCDRVSVVVAIDARHQKVALSGWLEETDVDPEQLARQVDRWGAHSILFTAIERDGMQGGPDIVQTARLQTMVKAMVIASGGVGSLNDLKELSQQGVRAAVCGRALYEKAFTVADALAYLNKSESSSAR